MKLSVSSWSFPLLTLSEAGAVANGLGFEAVDIGYFFASALDKEQILSEPQRYGERVASALPVPIANLFHLFGGDLDDRNLAGTGNSQNLVDLKSVLAFAKAAAVPSVFVLPGMVNPQQSRSEAIANSAEALKPMVAAGQDAGIAVLIEPHLHGILESPDQTWELLNKVPGLKVVLDLSHFVAAGFQQDEIMRLVEVAGHVHLRQARPGLIQTRMENGVISFPALFGALRDHGYHGWLTVEYEHEVGTNSQNEDVLSETVKMRDCFQRWNQPG